jgi:hypothetical protein
MMFGFSLLHSKIMAVKKKSIIASEERSKREAGPNVLKILKPQRAIFQQAESINHFVWIRMVISKFQRLIKTST